VNISKFAKSTNFYEKYSNIQKMEFSICDSAVSKEYQKNENNY